MINIWDFEEVNRIQLVAADGKVFEGKVVSVDDAEDSSDLQPQEDCISILTDDGQYIGFYQSEISSIKALVTKAS